MHSGSENDSDDGVVLSILKKKKYKVAKLLLRKPFILTDMSQISSQISSKLYQNTIIRSINFLQDLLGKKYSVEAEM